MASLTIRNLDEDVKQKLRMLAARNGHSMEAEARDILHAAVILGTGKQKNIGMAFYEAFQALGGVDLELPPREPARDPPDFS